MEHLRRKGVARPVDMPVDDEAILDDIVGDDDIIAVQPGPAKIGVAGAVFLILNKMIGTGSRTPPTPYPRNLTFKFG